MHVVLVHYAAPPVVGGVEQVLGEHAKLMVEAGHRVTVVAGRGAQWDARVAYRCVPLADSRHADVVAVKAELDLGVVSPAFHSLATRLALDMEEATAGADRVVAHNIGSLHKNLALTAAIHELAATGAPERVVLWHHDLAWTAARYRPELHPRWPWTLLRTDWAWRHVVVSAHRRRELAVLLGIDEDTIAVVPNGVDGDRLLAISPEGAALASALGLAEAAPLLLMPVRLTARKNVELAMETLAVLRRSMPAAAMVVTGPMGPHNPANLGYLERLLALRERLGLEGAAHLLADVLDEPPSDRVVGDLYRLADAVLFASFEEGFGIPVLEAALARRPVFAADIPSLRELGAADVSWFDPSGDPGAVAASIEDRLTRDPVYRLAVRARSEYTWPRIYRDRLAPVLGL